MNIRSKTIYLILSIFIFFSSSCIYSKVEKPSALSKEVPNNLEIRFDFRIPEKELNSQAVGFPGQSVFRSFTISGHQMSVNHVKCGEFKVTLTDNDLKQAYQTFVENKFDLIESEQSRKEIEEAGFREIHLQAGNISKSVKSGKQFTLSEKDRDRFSNIWLDLSEGIIEDRAVTCPK